MYRFLIKKKVEGQNELTKNLSSCVIEKFNGHEIIKNNLSHQEKINFRPIEIVYEPSFDERTPVVCNFTLKINLAYKSYMGNMMKGEEKVYNRTLDSVTTVKIISPKVMKPLEASFILCCQRGHNILF